MQITIKTTLMEITDAIQAYVDKKIGIITHLLNEHDQEGAIARVEIGKTSQHHHSGDIFYAEVNLTVDGTLFRATSEADDLYAAIDAVKDEVASQLKKHKDKIIDGHRTEPVI